MEAVSDKPGHRTALVTGGARGLGLAIVSGLFRRGVRVAMVDVIDGAAAAAALDPTGTLVRAFVCDLADADAVARMLAQVTDWGGPCGIVVHNAAIFPTTPLDTMSLAQWRAIYAVNVDAAMLIAQRCLPAMADGRWGRIVLIASGTIGIVRRDVSAYISSKMALTGLAQAIAGSYGPKGVTANVVAPGFTETEGTRAKFDDFESLAKSVMRQQAVPQLTTKEEIAGAVSFLCSDAAARSMDRYGCATEDASASRH